MIGIPLEGFKNDPLLRVLPASLAVRLIGAGHLRPRFNQDCRFRLEFSGFCDPRRRRLRFAVV